MAQQDVTITLSPWEHNLIVTKVSAELATYLGHKMAGLEFTKSEDNRLDALRALSDKLKGKPND